MQIHELNNFTGTLGSGAYLAIDDGTDTGKISSQGLLAATEARIDNIIAGPAPSAEEIVDARLGADGVTYPSLGDAIRDQITDAKSALSDIEDDIDAINLAYITASEAGNNHTGVYIENDITWEQGSWTSSGSQSSDYWIRTGLLNGGFVLHNHNTAFGYIVGKFTDAGVFVSYIVGGSGLNASEYINVPNVGAGYKVKIRSRLVDNGTTIYTPAMATARLFRPSSILSYDDFMANADVISSYSNLTANIAGKAGSVIFNATSAWSDIPFNGCFINAQYTTNYDIQIMLGLSTKKVAYRFVNRNNQTPYNEWQVILSGTGGSLQGKKVSIIGDSRSSYSGTVPSGNAYYYPKTSGAVLTSLSQMWWKRVLDYFGMTLVVNDSYSGGFVANEDGGNGANILSSDTAINNLGTTVPDIILVFAGVNDWNGNQVAIGSYDGNGTFPTNNATFREAFAMMLSKVQKKFPDADIWLCTNPYCCPAGTGSTISNMPVPNTSTGVSLDSFNDAIKDMAGIFGCGVIDFAQCGTNWGNLTEYTGDYSTDNGLHYNADGHALLADVAIATLRSFYS